MLKDIPLTENTRKIIKIETIKLLDIYLVWGMQMFTSLFSDSCTLMLYAMRKNYEKIVMKNKENKGMNLIVRKRRKKMSGKFQDSLHLLCKQINDGSDSLWKNLIDSLGGTSSI